MLGGDGTQVSDELTEMDISAVQESMNQMMGSASTSMSTIFNKRVDISPPGIDLLDISKNEGTDNVPDGDILVKISFRLTVGDLIDSSIMQLVTIPFAKHLVEDLMNPATEEEVLIEEKEEATVNEGGQLLSRLTRSQHHRWLRNDLYPNSEANSISETLLISALLTYSQLRLLALNQQD